MPTRPSKADFPLRDVKDPRVIYVLSNRARRISLKVKSGAREIHVVVPGLKAYPKARQFASQQRDWINIQLEALPIAQPFVPDGEILFQGERFRLVNPPIIKGKPRGRARVDRVNRKIIVPSPDAESFPGRVRRFLIREARAELEAASHHYADLLGKRVGKVSVRDTDSRWGSCITRNGEGHISYSWRLICAPPAVLEYVCAHECAHMIEANHSAAFWAVCDRIYEDVKSSKRWLSKHGQTLHAVGAEF